jgi:glycosyltransferase involved in cell wall biosynthesis
MRILALNWRCLRHPEAGGAEVNLFEQARRWVAGGHVVTVFCSDPGRDQAPERDECLDGVSIRRRGGRFTVYAWAALFLLCSGRRFDRILDVSNGIPFFTPALTRVPSVLLVHHVHGDQWRTEFPAPMALVGRWLEERLVPCLYRSRSVIAVSQTTQAALLKIGFGPDRLTVVHNGADAPLEGLATPTVTPTVVYLGRLKRYKRIERLVVAFAALRERFPAARLEIAGDGDARPSIEAAIDRLGLEGSVTLHGYIDDRAKSELLARATVFATPSMHEGWGVSVIEANAYGCPAVAYNVPGLSAAIRDDETGMLAEDDHDFQESIARILGDQALRSRLSASAQTWAARFSWDASAVATLAVLAGASVAPSALARDAVRSV